MAKTETLQSETKTRSHECFRFKKRYGEVRRGLWGGSVGGSGAEGNGLKENIFFNRAERFGCVVGEIRGDSGRRGKGGVTLGDVLLGYVGLVVIRAFALLRSQDYTL